MSPPGVVGEHPVHKATPNNNAPLRETMMDSPNGEASGRQSLHFAGQFIFQLQVFLLSPPSSSTRLGYIDGTLELVCVGCYQWALQLGNAFRHCNQPLVVVTFGSCSWVMFLGVSLRQLRAFSIDSAS